MAALLLPFIPEEENPTDADKHVWTHKSGIMPSAALLTRLGEAADGNRTGDETWLVAGLDPVGGKGHKVHGFYKRKEDAYRDHKKILEEPGSRFMIFGPFLTPKDDTKPKKNRVKCVILELEGGRKICLDGKKYDAVFWTMSAFDKFVVPYYTEITDLKVAAAIRGEFENDENVVAGTHIPGSEIISTDGVLMALDTCPDKLRPENDDGLGLHRIKAPDDREKSSFLIPF
jgi:hypothetical protein